MAIWCISESLALTISVTKISLDYQQQSQPAIWSCKFKSSVTIHLKLIPYTVYKVTQKNLHLHYQMPGWLLHC